MERIITTDSHGYTVLPSRPNEIFVVCENSDGSILLQPADTVPNAQVQYNSDADLRDLLSKAVASPTVKRNR